MRELDFLPPWYTQLQRGRRIVRSLRWATALLALAAVSWVGVVRTRLDAASHTLARLSSQLEQTGTQLQQMDRLEALRRVWRQKAEVLSRLGLHVDSSRLIARLSEVLPDNVSILHLSLDVEETPAPGAAAAAAAARATGKDPAGPPMERRLRVRLQGVAPTDVELATFLTELNRIPFVEQVAPAYARDRRDAGHVLREFELTFAIGLASVGE